MPLFLATYKFFNDTRSAGATYFATMDEGAMEADKGPDIKMHGRWHEIGNCAGAVIAEAPNAKTLLTWLSNWSETICDVDVKIICDDNATREIILKADEAPWRANYDNIGDEPGEGESLYMASFKFYPEHKMTAYTTFANLTEARQGRCWSVSKPWSLPRPWYWLWNNHCCCNERERPVCLGVQLGTFVRGQDCSRSHR
jgi:hypothetical protein